MRQPSDFQDGGPFNQAHARSAYNRICPGGKL